MSRTLILDGKNKSFLEISDFIFARSNYSSIEISPDCVQAIKLSERHLLKMVEDGLPIYGVTTGFGDSCFRIIPPHQSEALQKNLISYLLCGTGAYLSKSAAKAVLFCRLNSLSRGYSGVSIELIERMKLYLERDWIPMIPCEGSLGASGDLIPLAYVAQGLQGQGFIYSQTADRKPMQKVLEEAELPPYTLKIKEGLALVNGTSVMAGLSLVNLNSARFLTDLACLSTAWVCLVLRGRTESFSVLVNEQAKSHPGQAWSARAVLKLLNEEDYKCAPLKDVQIKSSQTTELVQDRYSLRCAPQILGPVVETLSLMQNWLELEVNGTSDNPIVSSDGSLAMGGNFYGGYLSQANDYLKISLAHISDMTDRQLMLVIDEKSNRGLPPNLADWNSIPADERFLHHGLKGLHQSVSALTSEIMAKATPNGIFSRSSESHNQDKVSLGMSAAIQCSEMIDKLFTVQALHLICLAQAIDLRGHELKGETSKNIYELIRRIVPFISRDRPLGEEIASFTSSLKELALKSGRILESY